MVSPAAAAAADHNSDILSWLSSSIKRWLSFESVPAATGDARTLSGFILNFNCHWTSTYTSCSLSGLSPLPLPDPSFSFINSRLCPADLSPPIREPDPRFEILSSSSGLILCCRAVIPSCTLPRTAPFISCVCNPTTKYYKAIPQPGASYVIGAGLAFDPSVSPHYQVVCFSAVLDTILQASYDIELEIYSSETGRWESGGRSWLPVEVFDRNGVYWGGAVNWVNHKGSLASFDVEKKQMLEIGACPQNFAGDILYFGESSGKLHLISTEGRAGQHSDVGAACFDIMEMGEGRSGWKLIYHVDLRGMENHPGIYFENTDGNGQNVKKLDVWPVYVVRGEGEEEEEEVVMSMRRQIVTYGLKNKGFRRVCYVAPTAAAAAEGGMKQALRARDVTPYAFTLASE